MDNNIINKYLSVIEQVVDMLNDGTIFFKVTVNLMPI